jgi:aminoglycoside phosphotransferase (APT) family kinase protein/SAM-dependent methyltransferase
MTARAPEPLEGHRAELGECLRALEAGAPFRDAWERLLVSIPGPLAYRMEWGSRESVGAAALMAKALVKGPILVLGSGYLGTAPALGILGRPIVVADKSEERARFAAGRGRSLGCRVSGVATLGLPLPFHDDAFALVCMPDAPRGLPLDGSEPLDAWAREAFRVLTPGGQVLVLGPNRLAYKDYTGLHGKFVKPGPAAYLRRAADPGNPEPTFRGYRRSLARAGFGDVKSYATYVSHLDYHYVASLRPGGLPALEVGRKERRNVVKWFGYHLGLFRWFAPSFATLGEKPGAPERPVLLDAVRRAASSAAGLDGRRARVDHLLATRGNAALALVQFAGGAAWDGNGAEPSLDGGAAAPSFAIAATDAARSSTTLADALTTDPIEPAPRSSGGAIVSRTLRGGAPREPLGVVARVPLCVKEVRLANRHFAGVLAVRAHQAARQAKGTSSPGERPVPTPDLYGDRVVHGVRVFVEERLPGVNGAQLTDDRATRARTYADLAEHLSSLVLERRIADDALLDRVLLAHARFVASRVRDAGVSDLILRVAANAAARLRGREIPVVIAHGDLRAKHCLVNPQGEVTGILDWGTLRSPNLPLYDLLHFIVHDRKQQKDESLNAATIRALHPRQFLDIEEAAIRDYCRRLGLDDSVRRACELVYPIEVPATTMSHWDFDRPRWVEVNFGEALRAAADEG